MDSEFVDAVEDVKPFFWTGDRFGIIGVKHNIEVAHRLYETQGKCEAIHGHSMKVHLEIVGKVNNHGILSTPHNPDGFVFGDMKKAFRGFLDGNFDHHVLLNENDPFAGPLYFHGEEWENGQHSYLPGLQQMPGDPTTEHIALWIAEWAAGEFKTDVNVTVYETDVNFAAMSWLYDAD